MKRWAIGSIAFFPTFVVGLFAVTIFLADFRPAEPASQVQELTTVAAEACPIQPEFVPEFTDLPDDEYLFPEVIPDSFIDLHNSGGLLRRSEVAGKNGEKWLVMFDSAGEYAIRESTARVQHLKTVSYAGDETDARISFSGTGRPIFAFRNIPNIKPGPISTAYLRPAQEEIEKRNLPIWPMESGDSREYNLNDNWYTLRVSYGVKRSGEKVGVLVMEFDNAQHVIATNFYEPGYGTIIGSVLWAGDIDNDGKLDLYFDKFTEKGGSGGGLYLSSLAEKGEFLKLAAVFFYGGC